MEDDRIGKLPGQPDEIDFDMLVTLQLILSLEISILPCQSPPEDSYSKPLVHYLNRDI